MSEVFHDRKPMFGFAGILNQHKPVGDDTDSGSRTWPDDFELVATVNTDDLDVIFELTNHIDHAWNKNKQVKAVAEKSRSTSVGDIVVNSQEVVFLCLPVGWRELGQSDKKIVIPPNLGFEIHEDDKKRA